MAPTPGARAGLVSFNLLAGLTFYGPAAVSLLESDSDRANVGVYLLTAGGAFLAPYLGVGKREVRWAATDLSSSLSLRGALHGALLAEVVDGAALNTRLWLAGLLSAAEAVGGYQYATQGELSAGEGHTLVVASDLGLLAGLFGGLAGELQPKPLAALTLAGSLAGFGAGELYRRRRAHTWGDAEAVRLAALLGLWATVPLGASLRLDSPRALGLAALATLAAGAAAGDALTRDTSLSLPDALIMDASAVGGGFLGAGALYMIKPDLQSSKSSSPYQWAALVGAMAGYALSYLSATAWEAEAGGEGGFEGAEEEGAPSAALGPWVAPLPRAGGRTELARGLGLSGSF